MKDFEANLADFSAKGVNLNEVALYMEQKGQEYRTIDKARARRIYAELKPHLKSPKHIIQVLGTNGKGSTGRFIAQIVAQNGFSILHFTSPHIFSFNERFYDNDGIMSDESLIKAHRFLQKFESMRECSYFEYATFLALFLAQGVDYLILEAGVGGELDSTSVVSRDLCVFSVIDYDHTEILGDSIEAIATTKLNAVFYPNKVPKMLLGAQKYAIVEKIAKDIAKKHSVEFFTLDSCVSTLESRPLRGAKNWEKGCRSATADFLLEAEKRGSPPKSEKRQLLARRGSGEGGAALLRKEKSDSNKQNNKSIAKSTHPLAPSAREGESLDCLDSANLAMTIESYLTKHNLAPFLAQNLALALKAVQILGIDSHPKSILDSLPKLDLRARFEQIAPNITIDVGHNQNAAFAIREHLNDKKIILVYNSYFQKNISEILGILKDNILRVEILAVDNPRIIEQTKLENILETLGIAHADFKAIDSYQNYLVFGSFSVVEAFMRKYGANKQ